MPWTTPVPVVLGASGGPGSIGTPSKPIWTAVLGVLGAVTPAPAALDEVDALLEPFALLELFGLLDPQPATAAPRARVTVSILKRRTAGKGSEPSEESPKRRSRAESPDPLGSFVPPDVRTCRRPRTPGRRGSASPEPFRLRPVLFQPFP